MSLTTRCRGRAPPPLRCKVAHHVAKRRAHRVDDGSQVDIAMDLFLSPFRNRKLSQVLYHVCVWGASGLLAMVLLLTEENGISTNFNWCSLLARTCSARVRARARILPTHPPTHAHMRGHSTRASSHCLSDTRLAAGAGARASRTMTRWRIWATVSFTSTPRPVRIPRGRQQMRGLGSIAHDTTT